MNYKYGIFDLDGTIIDAIPTYTKVFSEILNKKFELDIKNSSDYYLNSTGTPIDDQFEFMLKKNNISKYNISQMVDEFFSIVHKSDFRIFRDAKDVIDFFHKQGTSLFITTGSETRDSQKRLNDVNLLKYFNLVIGSDEIPKGPKHIEKFAESVNLLIEDFSKQAFYCGDGPRDMEIAEMLGIYAIGITQTVSRERLFEAGADVVVDKIADVMNLEILK